MRRPREGGAAALAVPLLALAWLVVASGPAGAAGSRDLRSHVLIGVTPDQAFSVAVEGEEIPASPALSDSNGILTFEFSDSGYPEGPLTVFVAPEGVFLVSDISVSSVTETSARVTWTTNALGTSLVEYGTSAAYGSTSPADTSLVWEHRVDLAGLQPGTLYHFRVVSDDGEGRLATSGDRTFRTAHPPLEIAGVVVADVGTTWATIEWETSRPADSRVEYGETAAYGSSTIPDPEEVVDHSVTIDGLDPGTTYHFRAASYDAHGSAVSDDGTFDTGIEPLEMTSPVVEEIGTTSAVVSWTTTRPATSVLEIGETPAYELPAEVDSTLAVEHMVELEGLAPGTVYHFRASSRDAYGQTVASGDDTLETGVEPLGMTPPVVEETGTTSAIVSWTTTRPATSVLEIGETPAYELPAEVDSALVSEHVIELEDLVPGTVYHFRASSRDGYGQTVASADATLETEVEPLGMTSPLVGDVGTTWAVISWETSRPALSSIAYGPTAAYGDTLDIGGEFVTEHSSTLSGLAEGALYHFAAISIDGDGVGAVSADSTFSTLDPGPMGPPTFENVEANPVSATSVSIEWSTNRPSTSRVFYGCGTLDCCTPADTTLTVEHSVLLRGIVPGRDYCFVAQSACGPDVGESSPGTFRIELPDGEEIEEKPVTIVRSGVWLVGETSATIRWVADRACSTWVEYGRDDYSSSAAAAETGPCGYEAVLSGLAPATSYQYRIWASDEIGGAVVGAEGVFQTLEEHDGMAPGAPTGFTCTLRGGAVEGRWDANAEADLRGYFVYRMRLPDIRPCRGGDEESPDGRFARLNELPLSEPGFLDTEVEAGVSYAYEVVAVDESGNESEPSERLVVLVVPPDPDALSLSFYPNPFVERATLSFAVPAGGGRVVARVYSAAGRLVDTIADGDYAPGRYEAVWHGRDATGRQAAPGVYFCELSLGSDVRRAKITLVR